MHLWLICLARDNLLNPLTKELDSLLKIQITTSTELMAYLAPASDEVCGKAVVDQKDLKVNVCI